MKKILIKVSEGFIRTHPIEFFIQKDYEEKTFLNSNSLNNWRYLVNMDSVKKTRSFGFFK